MSLKNIFESFDRQNMFGVGLNEGFLSDKEKMLLQIVKSGGPGSEEAASQLKKQLSKKIYSNLKSRASRSFEFNELSDAEKEKTLKIIYDRAFKKFIPKELQSTNNKKEIQSGELETDRDAGALDGIERKINDTKQQIDKAANKIKKIEAEFNKTINRKK